MIAAAGLLLLTLAGEPLAAGPALDLDLRSERWRIARMKYTVNARHRAGGYIAWIQTPDGMGAAFRCDKGILYAFVATRPVDIRANLRRLGHTKSERTLTATVGDFDAREEKWMSIHGGSFLMPRRISTTKRLFRGARSGLFARLHEKGSEPLTVEIPADTTGILDNFEANCELREAFSE